MYKEVKIMETKNVIRIVLKLLYQILVVFCLIVAVVIIFQKISDSNKSIAGYRIFRVITGSMEPAYDVGEVIISKEVDPKNIKVGDDIVYLGRYGEYNGKIIMHNVIEIETDLNGNLNFHAKGLQNNSVEDPLIKADQIYGVVKYKSKILTVLYKLATNIYSVFVIISVLVLNVFIAFRSTGKEKVQKLNEAKTTDNIEAQEFEEDSDEDLEEEEVDEEESEEDDESDEEDDEDDEDE